MVRRGGQQRQGFGVQIGRCIECRVLVVAAFRALTTPVVATARALAAAFTGTLATALAAAFATSVATFTCAWLAFALTACVLGWPVLAWARFAAGCGHGGLVGQRQVLLHGIARDAFTALTPAAALAPSAALFAALAAALAVFTAWLVFVAGVGAAFSAVVGTRLTGWAFLATAFGASFRIAFAALATPAFIAVVAATFRAALRATFGAAVCTAFRAGFATPFGATTATAAAIPATALATVRTLAASIRATISGTPVSGALVFFDFLGRCCNRRFGAAKQVLDPAEEAFFGRCG